MAKTTFANGTVVTAAFLNAINNPVFVDTPDDDGEIAKITNADLSTASGQLLPEWQTFRDMLRVTQATSTSISYTAGVVTMADGTRQVINAGTIGSLTGTTTYYIFVNTIGTVTSSTTYPLIGVLMAAVVVSGSVTSTITDLRPRFEVKPVQESIKLIGGSGSDGDFATGVVGTINTAGLTNLTLNRETYYFRNFTINAGHTVTLSAGVTYIYCSGTVSIAGTLTVNTAIAGGRNAADGGNINSNGNFTNTATGLGIGTSRGQIYNWLTQPYGSSGTGPNFQLGGSGQNTTTNGGSGGAGGGSVFIQAAGAVSLASTGNINAIGGNAVQATTPLNAFMAVGGAGGGSGGLVHVSSLASITTTAGGVINVSGGNGAGGQKGTSITEIIPGGAAGGGGWIVLIAPSITNNGTMTVAPGTNGANTAGTTFTWRGNAGASFAGLGGGDVINASPLGATSGQLVTRLTKPVA